MSRGRAPRGASMSSMELEGKKSSRRLMLALEGNVAMTVGNIEVKGREHLKEIPEGKRVIIAATHISSLDMPVVSSVLGKEFDIAITNLPSQHSFREDPAVNTSLRIAGKENFIPMDFSAENLGKMRAALESGKALVVAAHQPSREWHLEHGGYAAAYLASTVPDAIIVPVSVEVETKEEGVRKESTASNMLKRPDAAVFIGKPFELAHIDGMEELAEITDRVKIGMSVSDDERIRFLELKKQLAKQSDSIMRVLAEPLSEERKGPYGAGE